MSVDVTPLRRFKPYPEYKDSGVEWLRDVPRHWLMSRADSFVILDKTQVEPAAINADEVFLYSIPSLQETGDGGIVSPTEIDSAKLLIRGERVLVSKLNPRKGLVVLATPQVLPTLCSTEFVPLDCARCDAKWLFYLYSGESARQALSAGVQSATRSHQRVDAHDVLKMWHAVPPPVEQEAIAAFLDHKTAKIDALIAKKERLIELLQEKRTALITQAVTKGLDPNVPMKDSGVEWLGEIPAHWTVSRVKTITTAHKQGFYTEEAYVDDGVRLARITDIDDRAAVSYEEMPFVEVDARSEREFQVQEGDFLFARSGTIGRFGVAHGPPRVVFASYLIRFRFNGVDGEFLRYAFASNYFQESLISSLHGGANQNIHAQNIKDRVIALPPLPDQHAIARLLDLKCLGLDKLVTNVRHVLNRLTELRQALISAAVTGRIDVRDEAA